MELSEEYGRAVELLRKAERTGFRDPESLDRAIQNAQGIQLSDSGMRDALDACISALEQGNFIKAGALLRELESEIYEPTHSDLYSSTK